MSCQCVLFVAMMAWLLQVPAWADFRIDHATCSGGTTTGLVLDGPTSADLHIEFLSCSLDDFINGRDRSHEIFSITEDRHLLYCDCLATAAGVSTTTQATTVSIMHYNAMVQDCMELWQEDVQFLLFPDFPWNVITITSGTHTARITTCYPDLYGDERASHSKDPETKAQMDAYDRLIDRLCAFLRAVQTP